MSERRFGRFFLMIGALVMVLLISSCALANYISFIKTTPTLYIPQTLVPSLTPTIPNAIVTATPQDTATVTSTSTPSETPTNTSSPTTEPCNEASGTIQHVQVPSSALDVPLPASIYLPPCYKPEGNYPVLYLLHGQGMTDQFWIDLGVTTIADVAIHNGQTPFIMVFPYEVLNFDDNFTSRFPDAMINDLIPWVDSNYATCTQRICRAVGGISRGGGWAVKLAMRYFDLFGTLGGHSYGLMYGDAGWVQKQLETHTVADFPRIYLDRGEKDSLASDIDFYVEVLQANGIHPEFHIFPGGHTKSYWSSHVQEYMAFYMASWPAPFAQP